mmetsp:Transcript_20348/g.44140  ORF Transcript_20348/g.44140 Transcript_20348/m.44140 type:complete len:362 (+) Transcript_20348:696-1781(+)
MRRLDELEVDVHVVRDQPAPLELLLLGIAISEARRRHRLRKELLEARSGGSDLHQRSMRFWHQLVCKRADAEPDERAVVEDLRRDVRVVHRVAQMRHQQHVARSHVPPVECVVVDVAEQRARFGAVGAVRVDALGEREHLLLQVARARHREVARGGGRIVGRAARRLCRFAQLGLWLGHRLIIVIIIIIIILVVLLLLHGLLLLLCLGLGGDGLGLGRHGRLRQLHLALLRVVHRHVEERLLAVVGVLDDARADARGVCERLGRGRLRVVVGERVLHQIDEGHFVLEASHVLGRVRVLLLQRLVPLVVDALEVGEDVARHLRHARVDILVVLVAELSRGHLDCVDHGRTLHNLDLEIGVGH